MVTDDRGYFDIAGQWVLKAFAYVLRRLTYLLTTSAQQSLPRIEPDKARGRIVRLPRAARTGYPLLDLHLGGYRPVILFSREVEHREPPSSIRTGLQVRKDFRVVGVKQVKDAVHKGINMCLSMSQAALPELPDREVIRISLTHLSLGVDSPVVVIHSHPWCHILLGEAAVSGRGPLHRRTGVIASFEM